MLHIILATLAIPLIILLGFIIDTRRNPRDIYHRYSYLFYIASISYTIIIAQAIVKEETIQLFYFFYLVFVVLFMGILYLAFNKIFIKK